MRKTTISCAALLVFLALPIAIRAQDSKVLLADSSSTQRPKGKGKEKADQRTPTKQGSAATRIPASKITNDDAKIVADTAPTYHVDETGASPKCIKISHGNPCDAKKLTCISNDTIDISNAAHWSIDTGNNLSAKGEMNKILLNTDGNKVTQVPSSPALKELDMTTGFSQATVKLSGSQKQTFNASKGSLGFEVHYCGSSGCGGYCK